MKAIFKIGALLLSVSGAIAQTEERISSPILDVKIEVSAGGTILVVKGSTVKEAIKGDARAVYLRGNIGGLSKPCGPNECTGEPFIRSGHLFVRVNRSSDPPFVVSSMKDSGPKRPEIEVGTIEGRVVRFRSPIQIAATYEQAIPGRVEKVGGLEARSWIDVVLNFMP